MTYMPRPLETTGSDSTSGDHNMACKLSGKRVTPMRFTRDLVR